MTMKYLLKYRFRQVDIFFIIWPTLIMKSCRKKKIKTFSNFHILTVAILDRDESYPLISGFSLFFNEMFGNKMYQPFSISNSLKML